MESNWNEGNIVKFVCSVSAILFSNVCTLIFLVKIFSNNFVRKMRWRREALTNDRNGQSPPGGSPPVLEIIVSRLSF